MESNLQECNRISVCKNGSTYIENVHSFTSQWTNPVKCSMPSCANTNNAKLHNFPAEETISKIWKNRCNLPECTNTEGLKVCSQHFMTADFENLYTNPETLKSSAVPHNRPPFEAVKSAIDENESLAEQLRLLRTEKSELTDKIRTLEDKTGRKRRAIVNLKHHYDKLKKTNAKEPKNLLRKVFSDSQIAILLGRRKVAWSEDDLAMAFTLRHMGGKECYVYLKDNLRIPLPALSSVQKWATVK